MKDTRPFALDVQPLEASTISIGYDPAGPLPTVQTICVVVEDLGVHSTPPIVTL